MDPFSIGVAIAAFVGTVVVALVALSIKKLAEWFKARRHISTANRNVIGVAIAKRLNNKQYVEIPGVFGSKPTETQVVQAIYDRDRDEVVDARAIRSGVSTDAELVGHMNRGDGMIVFT
jgi:hypothetical protein